MAKRKAARRSKPVKTGKKNAAARPRKRAAGHKTGRKITQRPKAKIARKKAASARKAAPARTRSTPRAHAPAKLAAKAPAKTPRLDRARKILVEREPHDTPPSSLDMESHSSAARSGRVGMEHSLREHRGMNDVTTGDPDVDVEDAYFTGEEAPGGDNPTPDQDIVEDIGRALGVTYNDNEELKGADKLVERDKHRWELDPASSDDFKDRD